MSQTKSGKGKWIALGCLIPIVVVILGVGAVGFFAYYYLKDKLVVDPAAVERGAQQVMLYKFPHGSQGIMKLGIMGVDVFVVQSRALPPEASLVLARIPPAMIGKSEQEIRNALQARGGQDIRVSSTRTETRGLCGSQVSVRIQEGQSQDDAGTVRPATSMETLVKHQGSLRMVVVLGMGTNSRSAAATVFGSLSCPR